MQTPAQQTGQPGGRPSSCSSIPPMGNGPLRMVDCLPCGEGMSAAHMVRRLVGEVGSLREGRQTASRAPGYFAQCPATVPSHPYPRPPELGALSTYYRCASQSIPRCDLAALSALLCSALRPGVLGDLTCARIRIQLYNYFHSPAYLRSILIEFSQLWSRAPLPQLFPNHVEKGIRMPSVSVPR